MAQNEVERLLSTLEKQGLISKKNKYYVRNDKGHLSTPTEIQSRALKKFHRQILKMASDAIESQNISERNISGVTLALDPSKLPEAKEKIKNFIREMSSFLNTDHKSEVYQMEIQLFKLKNKKEKKDA